MDRQQYKHPVDDIGQVTDASEILRLQDAVKAIYVDPLIKQYGDTTKACEYLAKIGGKWLAVPTAYGSTSLPPCARIDQLSDMR